MFLDHPLFLLKSLCFVFHTHCIYSFVILLRSITHAAIHNIIGISWFFSVTCELIC